MDIEVKNLVKKFPSAIDQDELIVLDNFSCSINEGEILFITGPNGIGKTVFVKCLCGLEDYNEGSVYIDGKSYINKVNREDAINFGIVYLPQNLPQPNNISGYEFLYLAKKNKYFFSKKTIDDDIRKMNKKFNWNLKLNLNQNIGKYSSVDLQKLYIVKALISKANLLIFDEPTSQLQIEDSMILNSIIKKLNQEGLTIIIIAHHQQYPLEGVNLKYFSKTGLSPNQPSNDLFLNGNFVKYRHNWSLKLKTNKNEIKEISSGSIVSICGPSSQEFYNYFDSIGKFNDKFINTINPPSFFFEGNKKRTKFKIGLVDFDGSKKLLVPELRVFDNLLIGHWYNKLWTFLRIFILKKRFTTHLINPLISKWDVKGVNEIILLKNLSGGNKQRLLLGRIFSENVNFIIAGNIFAGLDNYGVKKVIENMRQLISDIGTIIILFYIGTPSETSKIEYVIADRRFTFLNNNIAEI